MVLIVIMTLYDVAHELVGQGLNFSAGNHLVFLMLFLDGIMVYPCSTNTGSMYFSDYGLSVSFYFTCRCYEPVLAFIPIEEVHNFRINGVLKGQVHAFYSFKVPNHLKTNN